MTDTPSPIELLRLMSVGSSVNLWGGYLNTALQTLERASKGYQALAVTGDATISWTNYSAANDGSVAFLNLTGPISSPATLTFPGYQHYLSGRNTTGAAVTIKCSGGTGVTIANGDRFLLYCDATDYYNAAPTVFATGITVAGKVSGMTAGLAGTDGVNVAQLAAAIAAAVIPGTAGTLLNSITDTTRGFLRGKVTTQVGSLTTTQVAGLQTIELATLNPGGDEQLAIILGSGYVGGFLDGGLKTSQFTPVIGYAYDCDFSSGSWTVNIGGMTTPQLGQEFKINKFGAYPAFMLGTVTGITNVSLTAQGGYVLRYSGSSTGFN